MRDILQSTLHKRYHLERELGKGGMGAVYLAQDLQLQRLVAIKVLPPELAVRPELRERFLRETRVAAGFSHPNIVAVHAVEEHPQLLAFVMGFIEGETLGQRVRRAGPLSGTEAVRMLQEIAWALSYAHGRGVVHRDIKPDNILIERATGRALVTDFGIARSTTSGATSLTQVGEVVGTPQFMSPEQAAGEPLDGRSDLYSLGVVAFFAVTGRLPFDAPSAGAVMAMHLTQAPPKVASLRPDLPQALCAAIDRCLEKEQDKRFENGEALAAALDPIRAARRDVSPSVRMFQLQATQGVRLLIIVVCIGASMFSSVLSQDEGLAVIIGALTIATLWALLAQLVARARYLLTVGHTFEEVRDGLGVILAERAEARAQERSNPRARKREANRVRIMLASFMLGIGGLWFVRTFMREPLGPRSFRVGPLGMTVAAGSASLVGIGLALLMTSHARSSGLDTALVRLWQSSVGRAAFRLAGWRLDPADGAEPSVQSAPSSAPLVLISSLSGAARRDLGNARTRIEQLEKTLNALAGRQRELESALADAGSSTPTSDAALRSRRDELINGLSSARDQAIVKRDRLASALENVRVQLLRLKSGVGVAADVVTELNAAESVANA